MVWFGDDKRHLSGSGYILHVASLFYILSRVSDSTIFGGLDNKVEHYVQMNTMTTMTTITKTHNENRSTLSLSGLATQVTSYACLFGNSWSELLSQFKIVLFSSYEFFIWFVFMLYGGIFLTVVASC